MEYMYIFVYHIKTRGANFFHPKTRIFVFLPGFIEPLTH
jgi:hypothetical protein